MAQNDPKNTPDPDKMTDLEKLMFRDYREDIQAHDDAIVDFDAYEAMHAGKTYDSVSRETSNGLTDSKTATIYLERAARVAGQLPSGEVQAFGKKDKGKALLMDILRQKWIFPNANAQRPFKTKMFLWQNGSSEYGYMPMYYDLNVSPSGYFGPDCWLWNPRMFIPQNGFTTVAEMDYVHALANKSPKFFQDILDDDQDDTWDKDAIREVIDVIKNATKSTDTKRDTQAQQKRNQSVRQVTIATRYESGKDGRWISFLPDFGYKVIRNIKNPHKNGRIPFVIKPCIPTFDSFYNIGDYQRSMPMQFANDGLDNFYFQGIKINLFPPTIVNAQGIIRHTISNDPGSVWEVTNNVNDVKRLETSTAGLSTYQAAKGMAQGAIQSIAGTTDTRSNADSAMDPGMGKTPEALKMIQGREGTRDNQDRELLEEAMQELIDGMLSLIPTMTEKIPVDLFAEEIKDIIKAGHTDVMEIFKDAKKTGLARYRISESKDQMRLRIDPQKLQGLEYRFELVPNSTAKKTKEEQLSSMLDFLNFIGKMPNALQQYQESTGKVPDWNYIFTQFGDMADIPGMDQMFTEATPPAQAAGATTDQGGTGQPTPEEVAAMAAAGGGQATAPVAPVAPVNPADLVPHTPLTAAEIAPPPTAPAEDPLVVNGVRYNSPEIAQRVRELEGLRR